MINHLTLVGAIVCKMPHNLSARNLPRARTFCITFDDFVGWAAHQTVFSVACNSNSYILATLQTVKSVIRKQTHGLDANTF